MMAAMESGINEIKEGEKIEATILSRDDDHFYLDLGGRYEGKIKCNEFIDPESLLNGDKVDVYVTRIREGFCNCSVSGKVFGDEAADDRYGRLDSLFRDGERVRGKITGVNKGGFEVDVDGERGFCPFSQIETGHNEEPEKLINKVLEFDIMEYDPERDKLVLGRRNILEEEKNLEQMRLLGSLHIGSVYNGIVRTVKDYGAFVDIGGIEGLLHISEISNEKVEDAFSVFTEGDEVEVMIKDIDREARKISLSRKELLGDPWEDFLKTYSAGDKVEGTVASIKPYGAFVDLCPGVNGLLHISKLGDEKYHRHPKEVFKSGDKIIAWIEKIDESEKKISLTRVEPGEDLSGQLEKLKKQSDMKERSSSGNAFGQLLDKALSDKE